MRRFLRVTLVLLCGLDWTTAVRADPPQSAAKTIDRPGLRPDRGACRSKRPAEGFFRPADLEGKPLRPECGQPGRCGRHRPVHAGHRQDARAGQLLRYRAGDPGLGKISRRNENRLRQSRPGGRRLQCRRKPGIALAEFRRFPADGNRKLCFRHHGRAGRQVHRQPPMPEPSSRSTKRRASRSPAASCR